VANINIQTIAQPERTQSDYTYTDLKLDLQLGYTKNNEFLKRREIKDIQIDYDYAAIRNSIYNLVTTVPGQRILNPEYGLNLPKYLFLRISESVALSIGNEVLAGITAFEPRVTVQKINVIADEANQQYIVELILSMTNIDNSSFILVGTLSNSGFFLNE